MMNLELVTAVAFGALMGGAVGAWRTWAYARKLIHFGISLDSWSDYSEPQRQAHGAASRQWASNLTPMHREKTS